jgi:hypothetical protein
MEGVPNWKLNSEKPTVSDLGKGFMIATLFRLTLWLGLRYMVFNVTFNNISVISWWSVSLVEETGVPGQNHLSQGR